MRERNSLLLVAAFLAGVSAGWTQGVMPSQAVTARLTPPAISMGTFYSGTKVHVEGTVPSDSEVIIAVRGPELTEVFNKVGRAGPIWVNTGKVSVSGIPSLLLVFSTKPVSNCLCRGEIDRCQFDAAAIKNQIKVRPATPGNDLIADEFLKLKYRQGSYQLEKSGIQVADSEEAAQRFTLDFDWPRNIPPGTYWVHVCACQDGNVKESLEIPFQVMEVGFPATIAGLARERPATYGIISVVVAVLAGFGIDFLTTRIFKKKVSAH
jgi:uncharacterized protein (TIGR02186 family)